MLLKHYLERMDSSNLPDFFVKYLQSPSLLRLKKVGYFCGMDYASKDIYDFSEYISRYDHSLTVSLIVYKLTKNKVATLAALFHDIATPCFSHVIDYMNEDYEKQESTEEYTEYILRQDKYLQKCLEEDGIDIHDISDFKKYTIVDNDRPKVCADRIDGIILTGIGWTKNINENDIDNIVEDMCVFKNEFGEDEIGFRTLNVANKVVEVNKSIDISCHSNEDNYMMNHLALITKLAIAKKYVSYEELYFYNEEELFTMFKQIEDNDFQGLVYEFENINRETIPVTKISNAKIRTLNPIVNGKRMIK